MTQPEKKIVVIEDEAEIRRGLALNLEAEGYQVLAFEDAESAYQDIRAREDIALGIFDVMLPGKMDGVDLCARLRDDNKLFPVLFLTARNRLDDKLRGFESGGDDYITKPFDLEELLARVHARLRRAVDGAQDPRSFVKIGAWAADLRAAVLRGPQGREVRLNRRETEILELLVHNRGRPVSRDEILDAVWGDEKFPTNRTIDNYIVKFRKILEADSTQPRYIITRHGMGYELAREDIDA